MRLCRVPTNREEGDVVHFGRLEMSTIRRRMTKPFTSIVLVVASNECSTATNNTHVVLISNKREEDGTAKDR